MSASEDRERTRTLAQRQAGRVARVQLLGAGLTASTIKRWLAQNYLSVVLPGVYAVGHRAPSREGDLWAAVLYAGPGAALSHKTAAEWRGLIDYPGPAIEVSTPRNVRSPAGRRVGAGAGSGAGADAGAGAGAGSGAGARSGARSGARLRVRVYGRAPIDREMWRGVPVVSVGETLIGLANVPAPKLVRRALSVLDFRGELDFAVLLEECRSGRGGSAALRKALADHDPLLARANEGIEKRFVALCRQWQLPRPEMNVWVHDINVDAYWADANLVVEFDGLENHSSGAQLRRDRSNELILRSYGLDVHRYDSVLLSERSALVRAELERALGVMR